ncbi:uncharacterized protein [Rhodnius prolixus]|uniref:uncharacterized protein n=1 Tax=Rhodnius prolixus TaxID=13249 RepID=UPI003D188E96
MQWIIILTISSLPTVLFAEFDCPGVSNCTCSRGINGDYDLVCPKEMELAKLIAHVLPKSYAQIQCTETNSWEELRLLAGIEIGPVNSFVLKFCPFPSSSFKELMKTFGVPRTEALQVTTHGNLNNELSRKHLEGLKEISKLNLNKNSLRDLPEDLFHDTTNVTWLDLKYNKVNLPRTIFRYIPKLEVLELGSNNLTHLEPGLFSNLTRLRLLNLWGNRLRNLTRALFSDVPNLEHLDLSSNGLNDLPTDLFADLTKLKNINLSANNFTSLPQGLFASNTNLERVKLNNNRVLLLRIPAGLLAVNIQSETFSRDCNVTEVLIDGSESVINLTLQRNC